MRAFGTVFLAAISALVTVDGGLHNSHGLNYGGYSYGSGLSGIYGNSYAPSVSFSKSIVTSSATPPVVTRLTAAPAAYSFTAPAVSYRLATVSAAPAVSYTAAPRADPAISYTAASVPSTVSYTRGPAVSYVAAAPAVSYVAAAPAASYVAAAPAASYVAAAPAASYVAAAPAVSYGTGGAVSYGGAPVNVGVIASGGSGTVRSHEIHTGSGNQAIRIEDFQAGDQIIRVHEAPQGAPQVAQVHVPGDRHHVRIVNHQSGPAHIERVVARAPTQVVDLQKPARPAARIIQVVKGQSPPPSIEFVNTGGSSHHVYYADDVHSTSGPTVNTVALNTVAVKPVAVNTATLVSTAPAVTHSQTAFVHPVGVHTLSTAPAYNVIAAAAAPVSTLKGVYVAPSASYTASLSPISYGLGGFHYGGLGYSTGYSKILGSAHNVFLDARKSASAKKSA